MRMDYHITTTLVLKLIAVEIDSDHIKELSNARPKQPFFFLKPPSSLLIPNSGPILRPKGVQLHYEVELGLVIGKTVKNFNEEDEQGAIDAIEGKVNQ
jgi:acylpyruvate hydrolase